MRQINRQEFTITRADIMTYLKILGLLPEGPTTIEVLPWGKGVTQMPDQPIVVVTMSKKEENLDE